MPLMLVFALIAAQEPLEEPTAPPLEPPSSPSSPSAPSAPWVMFVDAPLSLSATGTASKVETQLLSALGVRVGAVSGGSGMFHGGDVAVLVGTEGGGTSEVSVTRTPLLIEGRGVVGGRFDGGLFVVGGYGYGGLVGGAGLIGVKAFDDNAVRTYLTWATRAGVGFELAYGPVQLRIETGAGVRDARFELHSALALGARF